jgi:thymidine phosphorylase
VDDVVASGAALDRFRQLVRLQGGDAAVVDEYQRFPHAAHIEPLVSAADGYIAGLQADAIGRASMLLGAGRAQVGDAIDYGAGILLQAKPGDRVSVGTPLAELHVGAHAKVDQARALAAAAFTVSPVPPAATPLVLGVAA